MISFKKCFYSIETSDYIFYVHTLLSDNNKLLTSKIVSVADYCDNIQEDWSSGIVLAS